MRGKPPDAREVALTAVMTAATAALTMVLSIPFPPTRGYFNLGDAMVMLSGLLFGARLGGIAGGLGSAISDVLLGYGYFAPLTLIVKGTEGFLTGLIGHKRKLPMKIVGVLVGAIAMLVGYFSVEAPFFGVGPAFLELSTANILQVSSGAVISVSLAQIILRAYPDIKFFEQRPGNPQFGIKVVVIAVLAAGAVIGAYLLTGISP